jgi:coronin-7
LLDIFPDTKADKASVSSKEWIDGNDGKIVLSSLDPKKRISFSSSNSKPTNNNILEKKYSPILEMKVSSLQIEPSSKPAQNFPEAVEKLSTSSPPTKPKFQLPQQSSFRFMSCTPKLMYDDLKHFNSSLPNESRSFDSSSEILVFPLVGGGGQCGIWKTKEQPGRLPFKLPCVITCGSDLADFQVSPFDPWSLFTLSEDGIVRLWKINGDDTVTCLKEMNTLNPGRSCLVVHPTIQTLLLTTSPDGLEPCLKVWEFEAGSCLWSFIHPDLIFGCACSSDGQYVATICRDKFVRVFDARKGNLISKIPSHEGSKGARMAWLGDSRYFISTGFGK